MSQQNIRIIQHILQSKERYDLAVMLEKAYYEKYDSELYEAGEIHLFLHPDNFLNFKSLEGKDRDLLLELFSGLHPEYGGITDIKISIDTTIPVMPSTDTVYIFVDEAGDMDFSKNGSRHYMFTFLVKKRPFKLHDYLSSYRYDLLEKNLDPLMRAKLDIEAFHATDDNKYVRREVFNIISTFEQEEIKVYTYILEKPKVAPPKREDRDVFYIENLKYAIRRLLDKLNITKNFIIITDRLPLKQNKKKQVKALKEGIKHYITDNALQIRYDIFHHCSASSVNLQVVDYISWAIFRKWERGDSEFYDKIKKYIIEEEVMTADRKVEYYER